MPIKLLPACSYYKLLHEQALQSQIVTMASALRMVMCPYNITMLTSIFFRNWQTQWCNWHLGTHSTP